MSYELRATNYNRLNTPNLSIIVPDGVGVWIRVEFPEGVTWQQDPIEGICPEQAGEAVLTRAAVLAIGVDSAEHGSDFNQPAAALGAGVALEDGRVLTCQAVVGDVTGHQAARTDAGVASQVQAGQDLDRSSDPAALHDMGVPAVGFCVDQTDDDAWANQGLLADAHRTEQSTVFSDVDGALDDDFALDHHIFADHDIGCEDGLSADQGTAVDAAGLVDAGAGCNHCAGVRGGCAGKGHGVSPIIRMFVLL